MSGLNVSELITEVRNQLDEVNTTNVTDAQILAALNRGQRKGTNIIARKYDGLFVTSDESTTTVAGQQDYDIPAAAFGRRIEKVEIIEGSSTVWEVHRISFHKTTSFDLDSQITRPYHYALVKNKIKLYPIPAGSLTIRIWYTAAPGRLVEPQGRITSVNDASNYILVDSLGSDLTTDTSDGFNAYVNFIDYVTGDSKGSAQIAALDTGTNKLTIKTSGLTRSTVLGNSVSTSLPTDLSADDYVCVISGTCVPEIPGAYTDYLIQYAVVEIRRRLSEPTDAEFAQLKDLEEEIQLMWSGREAAHRVRKASRHWNTNLGTHLRRLLS